MTKYITLICEVFCHHFYLAAMYVLGALVPSMAIPPDPFEYDEILLPSQLRVAAPIHQSGFLETKTVR